MIYWGPPLFNALHGLHAIHTKHDKTMQSLMKTRKQTGSDDCTSTIIVDSRPAMIFQAGVPCFNKYKHYFGEQSNLASLLAFLDLALLLVFRKK